MQIAMQLARLGRQGSNQQLRGSYANSTRRLSFFYWNSMEFQDPKNGVLHDTVSL